MAQDDRQAQGQQLLNHHGVLKVHVEFAQLAMVTQHQQTEAVQFWLAKAHDIGVVQNISAMFVVVTVGDGQTNLMQFTGPGQLALNPMRCLVVSGIHHGQQLKGHISHTFGLIAVYAKFLGQPVDGGIAHVLFGVCASRI